MKSNILALGAGFALAFGLASSSALADGASETVTAETHAELAAAAADLAGVHMHLHHTVNCLVGPGGTGFDAKEMNPCANAGKGAIPDTTSAATKKHLGDAVTQAEAGIAATDLATAQKDASATAAMLKSK
jgi:hypothetical protein